MGHGVAFGNGRYDTSANSVDLGVVVETTFVVVAVSREDNSIGTL